VADGSVAGIGFHVMSAFAGGETAADVCGLLGIPEKWKIAFTVRLVTRQYR